MPKISDSFMMIRSSPSITTLHGLRRALHEVLSAVRAQPETGPGAVPPQPSRSN
jgi:hypothetical protein